jgi:hypothetical protein
MTTQERKKTREIVVTITEQPPGSEWAYTASAYGFEGAGETWIQALDDLVLHMVRNEEDGKITR